MTIPDDAERADFEPFRLQSVTEPARPRLKLKRPEIPESSIQRPPRLKLTRYEPTEAAVMQAVCGALQYHPAVARWWRSNTGAGRLVRSGGIGLALERSQFIRFGFPGSPDIHGYLRDGRALFIEVKRPSGRLDEAQATFLADAAMAGCCAFCARSADDVFREIPK